MSEHKHTAGPWKADQPENDDDWLTLNPGRCGGCDIAITSVVPNQAPCRMRIATVYDNESDAKLIAAAPELLAACEAALGCLTGNPSRDDLGQLESHLNAAISKAKGAL